MKGIYVFSLIGLFLLGIVLLSSVIFTAESVTSNNFTVTWYDVLHDIDRHVYNVTVHNLLSTPPQGRDFNLSILFLNASFNLSKMGSVVISEWKNITNNVTIYAIAEQCWTDNISDQFHNATGIRSCHNQSIPNGTKLEDFPNWKPTKMQLIKDPVKAESKSNFGTINIPKLSSKDTGDTYNGTKTFRIEFSTPITGTTYGWGSFGVIGLIDESTGELYHPWFNTTFTSCRNVTMEEINGSARVMMPQLFNFTGLTNKAANSSDFRLVNQSCTGTNGASQKFEIVSNTSTSVNAAFFANVSANANTTWSIFWNSSTTVNTANDPDLFMYANNGTYPWVADDSASANCSNYQGRIQCNFTAANGYSYVYLPVNITISGATQNISYTARIRSSATADGDSLNLADTFTNSWQKWLSWTRVDGSNWAHEDGNGISGLRPFVSQEDYVLLQNISLASLTGTVGSQEYIGEIFEGEEGSLNAPTNLQMLRFWGSSGFLAARDIFVSNTTLNAYNNTIYITLGSLENNITDTIVPTGSFQSPANSTNSSTSMTANYTVGDDRAISQCKSSLNNEANISRASCENFTFTAAEGNNVLNITFNDTSNNSGSMIRRWTSDTISPTCIIDSPRNGTYIDTNISLNVRCGDTNQLDTIWYSLNQGNNITLAGNANATILLTDNFNHFRAYFNDSANNTANNQTNVTLSRAIFTNVSRTTFVNNNSRMNVNITVNVTTGNQLDRVFVEFNSTNYTMTLLQGNTYNFSLNVSTIAESNFTIKFFANVSGNGTYQLNSSINTWFVFDTSLPRNLIFKRFAGDSFLLNESYFNITFNFTESIPRNMTILIIRPDDGDINQTLEAPANVSLSINWTENYRIGNYTINLTTRDEAGNTNTTQVFIAFGKANVSLATRLRNLNFTSTENAWGQQGTLIQNNSQVGYTLYLDMNITADGFLDNRTPEINLRINDTFDNWTIVTIQNTTSNPYTLTFYSNFVNFTSTRLSTTESYIAQANITSNVTLNFTYQERTGTCVLSACNTAYRYVVFNNFSRSFNAYIRFQLPNSQVFTKSAYHPRYFICTAGATREFACTTFTTAVDVTSGNNGNNNAIGYPVNMKEVTGSASASDLVIQTNQSIFLIEIGIPSGAFTQSTGGGDAGGGGGGGGGTIIINETRIIPEQELCPEGYNLMRGVTVEEDRCELIGPPPAETFLQYMIIPRFGSIAPIHLLTIAIIFLGLRNMNVFRKK